MADEVRKGARIDARGTTFDRQGLQDLIAALPHGSEGRRELHGDFSGCTFRPGCDFSGLRFRKTRFNGATFVGGGQFKAVTFASWVKFIDAVFDGPANFDKSTFGHHVSFEGSSFGDFSRIANAKFGNQPSFIFARFGVGCSFRGTSFGYRPKFRGAHFGSDTQFAKAHIGNKAEFQGAHFGANARFVAATFGEATYFDGVGFGDRAQFIAAEFGSGCSLRGLRFAGDVTFQRANFLGDAPFSHSTFSGRADFGEVTVDSSLDFSDARFLVADQLGVIYCGESARLARAVFSNDVFMEFRTPFLSLEDVRLAAGGQAHVDGYVNLRGALLGPRFGLVGRGSNSELLSVENADVRGLSVSGVGLRACRFSGAQHLSGMRLESGASFEAVPTQLLSVQRGAIAEEHLLRRNSEAGAQGKWYPAACKTPTGFSTAGSLPSEGEVARCYRELRQGREESANSHGASELYYGEMEMRRLTRPSRWTPNGLLEWFSERAILSTYRLTSGYGTRASRAILVLAMAVLIGAITVDHFDLVKINMDEQSNRQISFLESIFFVCRAVLLLPTHDSLELRGGGDAVQIMYRLIGPVLLGLAALSLRSRVKR